MKKALILFAALLFSAVVSFAQTEKGKQTLGLDLGFSFNKVNGVSINHPTVRHTMQAVKATVSILAPITVILSPINLTWALPYPTALVIIIIHQYLITSQNNPHMPMAAPFTSGNILCIRVK